MTFAELKTEVFIRLNENASSPVFWTEADVELALNEGYAEISDATEWQERFITVDILESRPYYDMRTLIPSEVVFLSVGPAFNETTNRWLTPSRVGDLDLYDRRWERVIGEPERILVRGHWWVRYWPLKGSESGTIKQFYTALPEPLVASTDSPGFPEALHLGLVEYACADLWGQDAEAKLALAAWARYVDYEKTLQSYVDGRVSVPLVHGHG